MEGQMGLGSRGGVGGGLVGPGDPGGRAVIGKIVYKEVYVLRGCRTQKFTWQCVRHTHFGGDRQVEQRMGGVESSFHMKPSFITVLQRGLATVTCCWLVVNQRPKFCPHIDFTFLFPNPFPY